MTPIKRVARAILEYLYRAMSHVAVDCRRYGIPSLAPYRSARRTEDQR
jgi:hypothetical protein